MRKLSIIIFLGFSFLFVRAQNVQNELKELSDYMSTCITELTDGYVTDSQITNGGASVDIKIPSKYTIDSLIPELNMIFRQIGFDIVSPWKKFDDVEIRSIQSFNGIYFLFNYNEKYQICSFIIPVPD